MSAEVVLQGFIGTQGGFTDAEMNQPIICPIEAINAMEEYADQQTASLQKQIEEKDEIIQNFSDNIHLIGAFADDKLEKMNIQYKEKRRSENATRKLIINENADLKNQLSQKDEMLEEVFEALKRNLHHSKNCATVEYGGPCDKCTCTYSYDRELLNQYQNSKK